MTIDTSQSDWRDQFEDRTYVDLDPAGIKSCCIEAGMAAIAGRVDPVLHTPTCGSRCNHPVACFDPDGKPDVYPCGATKGHDVPAGGGGHWTPSAVRLRTQGVAR